MGFAEFLELAGKHGLWNAVAAVGCLVCLLIAWQWTKTRNDVAKSDASDNKALTGALVKLVDKLGTMDERASGERSQTLLTIEKLAGRMEGMTTAILQVDKREEGLTKSLDGVVLTLDEFGGRIQHLPRIDTNVIEIKQVATTLETNLEGVISSKIGPVVDALTGVETALRTLTDDSKERDTRTNNTLIELAGFVREAKTQVIKLLEPLVLKHIDQFLPPDKASESAKETLEEKPTS